MLVAIGILGIAGVAILAGLQMSVAASDIHRKQTSAGAYVKNYAETIQRFVASGNYAKCAGPSDYSPTAVGFSVPPDYDTLYGPPRVVSVVPVRQNGDPGASCSTPSDDTGLQQVTIVVPSKDQRAEESLTIVLRRPCSASMVVCS